MKTSVTVPVSAASTSSSSIFPIPPAGGISGFAWGEIRVATPSTAGIRRRALAFLVMPKAKVLAGVGRLKNAQKTDGAIANRVSGDNSTAHFSARSLHQEPSFLFLGRDTPRQFCCGRPKAAQDEAVRKHVAFWDTGVFDCETLADSTMIFPKR